MKPYVICILLFILYSTASAQQLHQRGENAVDLDSVNLQTYSEDKKILVDEWPRFKEKDSDFDAYTVSHLIYPSEARKRFIEGVVYVSYIIDIDGKVKDVPVMQSSNLLLDTAAMDVVRGSPKWKPERYKGKAVRIKKVSKITFSLEF